MGVSVGHFRSKQYKRSNSGDDGDGEANHRTERGDHTDDGCQTMVLLLEMDNASAKLH
jgi:hypothetical protein